MISGSQDYEDIVYLLGKEDLNIVEFTADILALEKESYGLIVEILALT